MLNDERAGKVSPARDALFQHRAGAVLATQEAVGVLADHPGAAKTFVLKGRASNGKLIENIGV